LELRRDFETEVSDLASLILTHEEAGVVFNFLYGKNEAIRSRIPWDSFVFVEFEESGGVFELAFFEGAAIGLDFAEGGERVLELARESGGLEIEAGEESVGVDDGEAVGAGDEAGFEERESAEAPSGIGELVDKMRFGETGRLVFVEELAAVIARGRRVAARGVAILLKRQGRLCGLRRQSVTFRGILFKSKPCNCCVSQG